MCGTGIEPLRAFCPAPASFSGGLFASRRLQAAIDVRVGYRAAISFRAQIFQLLQIRAKHSSSSLAPQVSRLPPSPLA